MWTLGGRSVGICSVQETRFRKKSVRIISKKAAEYKLFKIRNEKSLGGVQIFLAKKWVDEVIDICRVNYKMIVIKELVQGINISVISVLCLTI